MDNRYPLAELSTVKGYSLEDSLPDNCAEGAWVGRAWLPSSSSPTGVAGPHVITVRDGQVIELSSRYTTMADVARDDKPVQGIRRTGGDNPCSLEELLENSLFYRQPADIRGCDRPCLLAPNDLQAIKACGVTFAASLMERVIEEKALGDPARATEIRAAVQEAIGSDLQGIVPGSPETRVLKQKLIDQGIWSPYLEVGIGPDTEVFTKSQPLSAIAHGAQLGVLSTSKWNNPEPELAFLVSPKGQFLGAALGNDVNLRDYEGRSPLLLGKAKDQNGACPIGPLFRLFDETFPLEDAANAEVSLTITGEDGFYSSGANIMSKISRTPESIIAQVCNRSHQYPDGVTIMLGTMFAPTEDRGEPGMGFTHKLGDRVEISSPKLGRLVNWVNYCHEIPEWRYGISDLVKFAGDSRVACMQRQTTA